MYESLTNLDQIYHVVGACHAASEQGGHKDHSTSSARSRWVRDRLTSRTRRPSLRVKLTSTPSRVCLRAQDPSKPRTLEVRARLTSNPGRFYPRAQKSGARSLTPWSRKYSSNLVRARARARARSQVRLLWCVIFSFWGGGLLGRRYPFFPI